MLRGLPFSPWTEPMARPANSLLLLLLLLFLLSFFGSGGRSSRAHAAGNGTLLFARENTVRNCSCPVAVRDCDYGLANLLCSCRTVLPSATGPASYGSGLTIWFTDATGLAALLNFTAVRELKLSLCGPSTLPAEFLAIRGLRSLRVSAGDRRLRERSLLIHGSGDQSPEGDQPRERRRLSYISFLDTALFNGNSSLKSYSVDNIAGIADSFPRLPYLRVLAEPSNRSYVITFIY
ncbi:uncharacterized protein C21orf62 homolog [Tachyglossus aculeatus]|uniref:uncharacterized protein C21orf62 homolog n=1 Tax=Tachyglossus aculeatus TaxID=9261 RepID=UPI0018F5D404|nr:uncharacterized protein C21orf62 homolog [Tachyglossus aculeatus]XP_038622276.1 uncharacterized protein C21orf62 homolog [Tachyglossus aculeatus]